MEAVRQAGLRAKATASDARGNEPRADLGDETRAETAASDARGSGPRTDLGDEARRRAYLEGVVSLAAVRKSAWPVSACKAVGGSHFSSYMLRRAPELLPRLRELLVDAAEALAWPGAFYEWRAAMVLKPGKPACEFLSYRDIWVQEQLWMLLLGCLRPEYDRPIAERGRAWGQAAFVPGRSYGEQAFGAKVLLELQMARGGRLTMTYLDFARYFPSVAHDVRFFADAWVGVHPWAISLVKSVHQRAHGQFKTAMGLTPPFALRCGAGIGCRLAPASTTLLTTIIYRLLEGASEGYSLPGRAGHVRQLLAFLFADDINAPGGCVRHSQLALDMMQIAAHVEKLEVGHDAENASKTALCATDRVGRRWTWAEHERVAMALGAQGEDTELALAELYKYLGIELGAGLSHELKASKAVAQLRALVINIGFMAAGGAASVASTFGCVSRGVLDSSALATPISAKRCAGLDAAMRRELHRLGHSQAHNYTGVSTVPCEWGGHGLDPTEPTARAALLANAVATLRGRDGEPARAAAEALYLTTAVGLGFGASRAASSSARPSAAASRPSCATTLGGCIVGRSSARSASSSARA